VNDEKDLKVLKDQLIKRWRFNWPLMDVLVGGHSAIDLPQLYVKTREDAERFLANYGYDPSNAEDRRLIHACIVESLVFIERQLMPTEWARGNRPPKAVLECVDARDLVTWASGRDSTEEARRNWSCAVLRVMHTIAHIHGVQLKADIEIARRQIMGRFEKFLFHQGPGTLFLGDSNGSVELDRVEWKNSKSRESIILKLLHKPGNVAETIYDILGIRIITKRKSDVMMVVKFLRDFYLVTFPNMIPKRSRNTIMGLDQFKRHVSKLRRALKEDRIDPQAFSDQIEHDFDYEETELDAETTNPHSAASYKSIQLTCRQLIRYQTPANNWQEKLESFLAAIPEDKLTGVQHLASELVELTKNWQVQRRPDEISVFYPFEVQILDVGSNTDGELGLASHERYKKSQVRTARKRILGKIL
jgi:uncharacterized protein (TIGR04562 family)